MLVLLLRSSGLWDVLRPYKKTEIKKPEIAYVIETPKRRYKLSSSSASTSFSPIEVRAVARAEKADMVKDKRKLVSCTASMNVVCSTPSTFTRSLPSNYLVAT